MLILIWIICAFATAIIAASKGRTFFGWLVIGLFFGIFALIVVACLPAVSAAAKPSPTLAVPGAPTWNSFGDGTTTPATKICPQCAEDVKAAALICRFCGQTF